LLTTEFDTPRDRAAAEKLPVSETFANIDICRS